MPRRKKKIYYPGSEHDLLAELFSKDSTKTKERIHAEEGRHVKTESIYALRKTAKWKAAFKEFVKDYKPYGGYLEPYQGLLDDANNNADSVAQANYGRRNNPNNNDFEVKLSDDYHSKSKASEELEKLARKGNVGLFVKRTSTSFGKAAFSVWGKSNRLIYNPRDLDSYESESATEVSEGFHGRPSTYIEDIIEIEHYHKNLAKMGDLVELEILDRNDNRKVTPILFSDHNSEDSVSVSSTPQRNQIILSGGNQQIDIESFNDLSDNEKEKDLVEIGEIYSISYYTDKHHLSGPKYQKDGTEYVHIFGEEVGGEKPRLVYDRLNSRILLIGGSYEVRDEGIYN